MSLDVNISELEQFNSAELHSCIEEVARLKGIEEFEYNVEYITSEGVNFIANIFRVSIKEIGTQVDTKVIVKTLINTAKQELFCELHEREVNVYKHVIPKFRELQNSLNDEDKLVFPECVYVSEDKGEEILVLGDLNLDGFEMDDKLSKFENLEYLQVRLALTELAKFHALSLVYEKTSPESFLELKSQFEDVIFKDSFLDRSKLRNYFYESFDVSLREIDDSNAKSKLEQVKEKLLNVLRFYTKPKKHNVLCHGDYWINNVLFKTEDDRVTRVCLLDFQAMRYANPLTDFVYFIYICTNSEFRAKYLEQIQRSYYDTFEAYLNLFNIDSKSVYSKECFMCDIDTFLPYGLLIALIELRLTTVSSKDEDEIQLSNNLKGTYLNENYLLKMRINDVVEESVKNGVLDKLIEVINEIQIDS